MFFQTVVPLLVHPVVALPGLPGQHINGRVAVGALDVLPGDGNPRGMAEGGHVVEDLYAGVGGEAAVDGEGDAGDEGGGLIVQQEQHGPGVGGDLGEGV